MSTGPVNIYLLPLVNSCLFWVWYLHPHAQPFGPSSLFMSLKTAVSMIGEEIESAKSKTVGYYKGTEFLGGSWRETEWFFKARELYSSKLALQPLDQTRKQILTPLHPAFVINLESKYTYS